MRYSDAERKRKQARIIKEMTKGAPLSRAARLAGVAPSTAIAWRRKDSEFDSAVSGVNPRTSSERWDDVCDRVSVGELGRYEAALMLGVHPNTVSRQLSLRGISARTAQRAQREDIYLDIHEGRETISGAARTLGISRQAMHQQYHARRSIAVESGEWASDDPCRGEDWEKLRELVSSNTLRVDEIASLLSVSEGVVMRRLARVGMDVREMVTKRREPMFRSVAEGDLAIVDMARSEGMSPQAMRNAFRKWQREQTEGPDEEA